MEKTILTSEGKKQLEEKLAYCKNVRRQEVSKRIGEAREFGDLSENAEYDAAKEEQAKLEEEITEMEAKLNNCVVIDHKKVDTSKVSLGCFVKVYDKLFEEEVEYKIVGSTESDPTLGLISNESVVGEALLGKKIGELAFINTPAGDNQLKVIGIRA